jgi:hypothetical protein
VQGLGRKPPAGPHWRYSAVLAAVAVGVAIVALALWAGGAPHASSPTQSPHGSPEPVVVWFWPTMNSTVDYGQGAYEIAIVFASYGFAAGNMQFRYENSSGGVLPNVLNASLFTAGGSLLGVFSSSHSTWSGALGWTPIGEGWMSGANSTVLAGDYLIVDPPSGAAGVMEGYCFGLYTGAHTSVIG